MSKGEYPHGPVSLQGLQEELGTFKPRRRWMRRWVQRSAVAIMVRSRDEDSEILMIKRADREGDPWSGHMAFPGGRMDPGDGHGLGTALRETREEIGVDLDIEGRCIGRLSDIVGRAHRRRRAMIVTPYVFRVDKTPAIEMNEEVADTVWVPLSFLRGSANREKMQWQRGKISLTLPCYLYRGYRIWGLSLMMIDELTGLLQQTAKNHS